MKKKMREIFAEEFAAGWPSMAPDILKNTTPDGSIPASISIHCCINRALARIAPLLDEQPRAMTREEMTELVAKRFEECGHKSAAKERREGNWCLSKWTVTGARLAIDALAGRLAAPLCGPSIDLNVLTLKIESKIKWTAIVEDLGRYKPQLKPRLTLEQCGYCTLYYNDTCKDCCLRPEPLCSYGMGVAYCAVNSFYSDQCMKSTKSEALEGAKAILKAIEDDIAQETGEIKSAEKDTEITRLLAEIVRLQASREGQSKHNKFIQDKLTERNATIRELQNQIPASARKYMDGLEAQIDRLKDEATELQEANRSLRFNYEVLLISKGSNKNDIDMILSLGSKDEEAARLKQQIADDDENSKMRDKEMLALESEVAKLKQLADEATAKLAINVDYADVLVRGVEAHRRGERGECEEHNHPVEILNRDLDSQNGIIEGLQGAVEELKAKAKPCQLPTVKELRNAIADRLDNVLQSDIVRALRENDGSYNAVIVANVAGFYLQSNYGQLVKRRVLSNEEIEKHFTTSEYVLLPSVVDVVRWAIAESTVEESVMVEAEITRLKNQADKAKIKRVMRQTYLYKCMILVDKILGNNTNQSGLTCEETIISDVDKSLIEVERLRTELDEQTERAEAMEYEATRHAGTVVDLQAIVDKLPKTADGVPVVPGMNVFYYSPYQREVFRINDAMRCKATYIPSGCSQLNLQWVGVDECYSTRLAAKAAGGEG